MRKFFWTLALLALPYATMHACGGDDSSPAGAAGSSGAGTTAGSGGKTGSTATTTGTTTTTGTGTAGHK